MNKPELMEEVRYHRQKEEEYENLIKKLKHDVKKIKDELNEIKSGIGSTSVRDDFETRLIQIELRLAEQEQYTRRECVGIVRLPENLKGEELEAAVLNVFEVIGVPMEKGDFHAIHRLRNTRMVIAKVCNRRDAIAILRNHRKLRELSQGGKCNALLKKKYVDAFYTINGKVKIKYGCRNGQETTEISHEKDLIEVFGIGIMRAVDEEHESKINPHN